MNISMPILNPEMSTDVKTEAEIESDDTEFSAILTTEIQATPDLLTLDIELQEEAATVVPMNLPIQATNIDPTITPTTVTTEDLENAVALNLEFAEELKEKETTVPASPELVKGINYIFKPKPEAQIDNASSIVVDNDLQNTNITLTNSQRSLIDDDVSKSDSKPFMEELVQAPVAEILADYLNSKQQSDTKLPQSSKESQGIVSLTEYQTVQNTVAVNQPITSANANVVKIEPSLFNHQWADTFSEKIVWVSQQNLKSAVMHINPPELGPIEVNIKMNQDQASVAFSSAHQSIRDIIEQAIPKLRELFEQQGLQLTDANVSQQSFSQGQERQSTLADGSDQYAEGNLLGSDKQDITSPPVEIKSMRLIDYFV